MRDVFEERKKNEKRYNPDSECENIMNNIEEICKNKGISHYVLANLAEISTSTLYGLMKGKTKPYMYTIYKICNALDVTIETILRNKEQNEEENKETLLMHEKRLISIYQSMPEQKKRLLEIYADMLEKYEQNICL